ncbi:MAG: hypothetical protein FWH38_00805 [Treponema sp.]|nr:hypothetical protein [Treponema sp.]
MKRKLLLALIAFLAFGLVFTGCPTDSSDDGPPTPPPGGLQPWAPADNPPEPDSGYKSIGVLTTEDAPGDWSYSAFAGVGGEAEITENADGTYAVTIKTNPGGVSMLCFNNEDGYLFKKGYYLSLDLPTTTDYKPIAALTFPNSRPGDGGAYWGGEYAVNRANGVITDTNIYLAGQIDFAWEYDYQGEPFSTVGLYFYWPQNTAVGWYEFTVKKLLVTEGDDLSNPYPTTAWNQPSPPEAPTGTGWVDITGTGNIKAITPGTFTKNGDFYDAVVKTRANYGNTAAVFQIINPNPFDSGYYLLLDLPENTERPPIQVSAYLVDDKGGASDTWERADWDTQIDIVPTFGQYIAGDVAILWEGTVAGNTGGTANSIMVEIYQHSTEGINEDYAFTIKKIMVKGEDTSGPPPYEGVVTNVTAYLQNNGPWEGSGDKAVTLLAGSTVLDSGDFEAANVKHWEQFVLDVYFPASAVDSDYEFILSDLEILDETGANTLTEANILAGIRGGNDGNGWASQANVITKKAEGVYTVKMTVIDNVAWDGPKGNGITRLVIDRTSTVPVQSYSFKIELAEELVQDSSSIVPAVKAYLQETAGWTGPWDYQYIDDPNTSLSIDYDSGVFATGVNVYDQFVLDLFYPASAVGKDYEFTLSEVQVFNEGGTNTLTETEILAGLRGGNEDNGWSSQPNVVTKSGDVYLVKMTVIADASGGITRFIINRADPSEVHGYSFKAELAEGFAE